MQTVSCICQTAVAALLLLVLSTGCDAQQRGAAVKLATASGPSRTFEITDPAWGISAATVRTPADWGFAGTVVHASNCALIGHSIKLNAESPDQLFGVETLPALQSIWISDPRTLAQLRQQGCPILQSVHAADFIERVILPHTHPNARVLGAQPFRDYQPLVDQTLAMIRQNRSGGNNHQPLPTVESARVRIGYERNGRQEEEVISAAVMCTPMNMPNVSMVGCIADQIFMVHALAG